MLRALAFALLFVLGASNAHAQTDAAPEETPEVLLTRAEAALAREELETALALFRRADALSPSARARVGVGLAGFGLGDDLGAYEALTSALAERRNPLRGDVRARATAVLERITATYGRIRLNALRRNAEISVDGDRALIVAGVLLVRPGEHEVVVRAPGYARVSQRTEVHAGEEVRVRITLRRESASSARAEALADEILRASASQPRGGLGSVVDHGSGIGVGVIGSGPSTSPRARATTVRMLADPVVSGQMSVGDVRGVLRAHASRLQSCVGIAGRAPEDGALSLAFEIDERGTVRAASMLSTTLRDRDVGVCMVGELRRLTFAAEADRGTVRVRIELTVDHAP